ncbi:efflux RND transporter permease subunit [Methylobacillus flagellatus]|uniref:Cation/multidrug efflux pump-like protein n=1 Tax=Methylobacillus flagellatus (strain ATCC 51484 / DSM 6875 / VKM B-1610 / KT) TaxID=265072 RepID=Q1GY76_METFK|nr:efflux RND transporter permease subunit [Methylobacillus flagellatus]ABE50811.1 Cation/multidrug efflux pump-like protein [Methylobacillus flagellatus KT]
MKLGEQWGCNFAVDDAIVVVENVERLMTQEGLSAKEAARKSMDQIQGALISIGVVISAVFLPMAFISGSTGVIYRQFSITIVAAMAFSVLVAIFFTPMLCATLLKANHGSGHVWAPFRWFNRVFERGSHGYQGAVKKTLKNRSIVFVIYLAIVGGAGGDAHQSAERFPAGGGSGRDDDAGDTASEF